MYHHYTTLHYRLRIRTKTSAKYEIVLTLLSIADRALRKTRQKAKAIKGDIV